MNSAHVLEFINAGGAPMNDQVFEKAKPHFKNLVREQLERVERMKQAQDWVDYNQIKPIIIGFCWGDGIGPIISQETQRVLEYLLADHIRTGKIEFRIVEGL